MVEGFAGIGPTTETSAPKGHHTFLAVPWYGAVQGEAIEATDNPCEPPNSFFLYRRGEAFVDLSFSNCWATALNHRKDGGFDRFAMCHTDVLPLAYPPDVNPAPGMVRRYWLDDLNNEMDRTGADLLSVVLPIKTDHGLTSTALMSPDGDRWRRLTLREVAELPDTFDAETAGFPGCKLLASTGLWVARLTEPWCEQAWFQTHCRMTQDQDGKFVVKQMPEDWFMSMCLHAHNAKVMATKIIPCLHYGQFGFPNYRPWGSTVHDLWHEV